MRTQQLPLHFKTWGGARQGAGRKPRGPKPLVSHRPRPELDERHPLHVVLRVLPHVWSLRSGRSWPALQEALRDGSVRAGFRLVHFSLQSNHVHLIVEADAKVALSRGMQGLAIRMARALNRLMRRRGRVFADHYFARPLPTPTEVARAVTYVLENHRHHMPGAAGVDRFSSAADDAPRGEPRTWLLIVGWRRALRRGS